MSAYSDTRIERLISLIETGSSSTIRVSAAHQLAEISKKRHLEFYSILIKVVPLCWHNNGDVRKSAALALQYMFAGVNIYKSILSTSDTENSSTSDSYPSLEYYFDPKVYKLIEEEEAEASGDGCLINYANFDVSVILSSGDELLGSAGDEYMVDLANHEPGKSSVDGKSSWKDRIEAQKKMLKKNISSLGLPGGDLAGSAGDLIKYEDIAVEPTKPDKPLSARERYQQKRKKQQNEVNLNDGTEKAIDKKQKYTFFSIDDKWKSFQVDQRDSSAASPMPKTNLQNLIISLAQIFVKYLDDPNWIVRHGCSLALTSLLLGGWKLMTPVEMLDSIAPNPIERIKTKLEHADLHYDLFLGWLYKIAQKSVYILACDKFADYHGHKSSFPVRESVAKLLGQVVLVIQHLKLMNNKQLADACSHKQALLFDWLLALAGVSIFRIQLHQKIGTLWPASHGGLLALQEFIRKNICTSTQTNKLLSMSIQLLSSTFILDDDVLFASAELLELLLFSSKNISPSEYIQLQDCLWRCLQIQYNSSSSTNEEQDQQQLSSSISILMRLLLHLSNIIPNHHQDSSSPIFLKLLEFRLHPLREVRASVFGTLLALLEKSNSISFSDMNAEQQSNVTLMMFQTLLLEDDAHLVLLLSRLLHYWINSLLLVEAFSENCLKDILRWLLLPSGVPYVPGSFLLIRDGRIFLLSSHRSSSNALNWMPLGFKASDLPILRTLYASECLNKTLQEDDAISFSADVSKNLDILSLVQLEREIPRFRNKWLGSQIAATYILKLVEKSTQRYNGALLFDRYFWGIISGKKPSHIETKLYTMWIILHCPVLLDGTMNYVEDIRSLLQASASSSDKISSRFHSFLVLLHLRQLNSVLPEKLNPFIRPLMSLLKGETSFAGFILNPSIVDTSNIQYMTNTKTSSYSSYISDTFDASSFCRNYILIKGLSLILILLYNIQSHDISRNDNELNIANNSAGITRQIAVGEKLIGNILGLLVPSAIDSGSRENSAFALAEPYCLSLEYSNEESYRIWSLGWPHEVGSTSNAPRNISPPNAASVKISGSIRGVSRDIKDLIEISGNAGGCVPLNMYSMTPRDMLLRDESATRIGPIILSLWVEIPYFVLNQAIRPSINTLLSESTEILFPLKTLWLCLLTMPVNVSSIEITEYTSLLQYFFKGTRIWRPLERFWMSQILFQLAMQSDDLAHFTREWLLNGLSLTSSGSSAISRFSIIFEVLLSLLDQAVLLPSHPKTGIKWSPSMTRSVILCLVVPAMKWMSFHDSQIRLAAAGVFSRVMRVLPLLLSTEETHATCSIDESYLEGQRIRGLFSPDSIPAYKIPFELPVVLRPYQNEGINWLRFLHTYGLHGILADDMGLGKTLQTLVCILSSHTEHMSTCNTPSDLIVSLIVAPGSVLGHWQDETKRFLPKDLITSLLYAGTKAERIKIIQDFKNFEARKIRSFLIIVSYETLRTDLSILASNFPLFHYIILDEGHVMKNPKSRITAALKDPRLKSVFRLILSGTPIQNHVLDLWCLFDWLLPGYLGTLGQFMRQYGKPILAYKLASILPSSSSAGAFSGSKSSSTNAATKARKEKYLLALEQLHNLTLPFMLRRLKEDVLQDLPSKTIVRMPCVLLKDSFQGILYVAFYTHCNENVNQEKVNFVNQHPAKDIDAILNEANLPSTDEEDYFPDYKDGTTTAPCNKVELSLSYNSNSASSNAAASFSVFQMLHILKKICNHPALLLHPKYNSGKGIIPESVLKILPKSKESFKGPSSSIPHLESMEASVKFQALKQILIECNIIFPDSNGTSFEEEEDIERPFTNTASERDIAETGTISDVLEGEGDLGNIEDESEETGPSHNSYQHSSESPVSRVLIFCHSYAMLNILEHLFFKKHFPEISYLRLDGRVPVLARTELVNRFQRDDSIQVMLLTTAIGGQGLNLTGANVVIFYENHYNPAVDLQAMDRVHRLGQKNSVVIYKLFISETVEEKLLNLQEFKMSLVKQVITSQNVHLSKMSTKDVMNMLTDK